MPILIEIDYDARELTLSDIDALDAISEILGDD